MTFPEALKGPLGPTCRRSDWRSAQGLVSSCQSQNLHPAPWLGRCSGAGALSPGLYRCWSRSHQLQTAPSPPGSEELGPLQPLQWLAGRLEAPQKSGAVPQQAGGAPRTDLQHKNGSTQQGWNAFVRRWNAFVHHHSTGAHCYPLLPCITDPKSIHIPQNRDGKKLFQSLQDS